MIKGLSWKSLSKMKTKAAQVPLINIEKSIYKQFKSRYSNEKDFYNKKIINEIITNETAHIVALFKDYLITDDISEFLHCYYKLPEALGKLPKIFDYYESCSMIFPNYVILHEKKYICKNIQRKQRIIDIQQVQDEQQQRRKKDIETLESSVDTFFNTKTFDSLLNVTGNSIIMKAVGNYYTSIGQNKKQNNTKEWNSRMKDSIDSINNLIATINECEVKYEKYKENSALVVQVNKLTEKRSDCFVHPKQQTLKISYNNYLATDANTYNPQIDEHHNKSNCKSKSKSKVNKNDKVICAQMETISNLSSTKLKISSIGFTESNKPPRVIKHKNTLSMPKLSPRLLDIVSKHAPPIKPVAVNEPNNNNNNQNNIIDTNNNEYAPLTSRDREMKPKLNLKSDFSERMYKKINQNGNGSRKNFNSMSTATPSLSLKTQHNQLQHQLQTEQTYVIKENKELDQEKNTNKLYYENIKTEQIYSKSNQSPKVKQSHHYPPKQRNSNNNNNNNNYMYHYIKYLPKKTKNISSANKSKKAYENLYDKYHQKTNQLEHRNNRNKRLSKINPGFILSYDFSSNPITNIFKTTRQITFSNELEKRLDQKVQSYRIKGFDDLVEKENRMACYHSDREKDSKPICLIANVKYQKVKR